MVEIILVAAIHFDDGKPYSLQPKNIDTGFVLCGHRHGCIFEQTASKVMERRMNGIIKEEQGLLTNTNRFVGRKEAKNIVVLNQQPLTDDFLSDQLYSENLY